MNVDEIVTELLAIDDRKYDLEGRLSERAGEWYKIHSGRTHFHPLVFVDRYPDYLAFTTATRMDDERVRVPLSWFEGVDL